MNYESLNELTLRDKLSEWYQSPLGEIVYAEEMSKLEEILPRIFGYHILQFGYCAELNYLKALKKQWFEKSRIVKLIRGEPDLTFDNFS